MSPNPHILRRTVLAGGVGFDVDAQAYFDAASITDTTEQNAANTLIVGLKGNGLWTGIIALYLISPTSLAAAAVNARNPGTFDVTWVNTPTHTTTGVDFNGTTQYGRLGVIPNDDLTINDIHISYYSIENVAEASADMGCSNSDAQMVRLFIRHTVATEHFWDCYNTTAGEGRLNVDQDDSSGFFVATVRTSTDSEVYRNGTSFGSIATGGGSQPTFEFYIGARNSSGSATNFGSKECAFASIGGGLTGAQNTTFNTLVTTYETNVISGGRNV